MVMALTYAMTDQVHERCIRCVALVARVSLVIAAFLPTENKTFHFRTFFTQTNHHIPMQPMQPLHREQQDIQ